MPFIDHIRELRKRLVLSTIGCLVGAVVAYLIYPQVIAALMSPFNNLDNSALSDELFITTLFEGFVVKLKLSLILGVILSFPLHLYNLIRFVFPGLKRKEKIWISVGIVVSFGLAMLSFYMSYFKLIPMTAALLTTTQFIPQKVGLLLNFQGTIFYVVQFIVYALLLFQLPILLEILLALNMVSRKALWRSTRFVVIGIFVLCAVVTPPDIISQISLALPLILLFFITLLVARIFRFGEGHV